MEQRLIDALDSIRGGADIYARHIAMQLREIQKLHPEYINICKPMAYEGDGSDQVPFSVLSQLQQALSFWTLKMHSTPSQRA